MFDARRGLFGLISLTVHAGIVVAALQGPTRAALTVRPPGDSIIFVDPGPAPDRPPPGTPVVTGPVVPGPSQPLPYPVVDVPRIPPIDSTTRFGVGQAGPQGGPLNGAGSDVSTGPYQAGTVEEPPEILAGLPLRYPELLRQAGIEGRVIVELVVDTLGKAESGTVRVVTSSYAGFDAAALECARRALFRPGRIGGRAVRVLVRLPIEFHLRR